MRELDRKDEACGTYIQGLELCNGCLRNIGFYRAGQKWNQFYPQETEEGLMYECHGFISRELDEE